MLPCSVTFCAKIGLSFQKLVQFFITEDINLGVQGRGQLTRQLDDEATRQTSEGGLI